MSDSSFALDIAKFGDKAAHNITEVVAKTAIDALKGVVLKTPVGDPSTWKSNPPKGYTGGSARANWQTTLGTQASGEVPGTDKDGGATITKGSTTIESSIVANSLQAIKGKPEISIFVTNNLPYIKRLEDGWSDQAPSGMVKVTLRELPGLVERHAGEVNK